MDNKLRQSQHKVKRHVAPGINDLAVIPLLKLRMARPKRPPTDPRYRLHFIPEWAAARQLKQADIVRATGADKSNVSRWFSGTIPTEEYIKALAAIFGLDDPKAIFRHPDDDWVRQFFQDRTKEEMDRIHATLEAAFPRKRA